jgi:hypothetical protein
LAFSRSEPVLSALFCLPERVTGSQLYEVLMQYLREHPEQRHHGIRDVIAAALGDARPCE